MGVPKAWSIMITASDETGSHVELWPLVAALGSTIHEYHWFPIFLDCLGDECTGALWEASEAARKEQRLTVASGSELVAFAHGVAQSIEIILYGLPIGTSVGREEIEEIFWSAHRAILLRVQDGMYFTVMSKTKEDIDAIKLRFPTGAELEN